MKTSSAKAKGRRLQQFVRDTLIEFFNILYSTNKDEKFLLTEDDIRSTGMGQQGEDIQLSSKARQVIPFNFECKNNEKLNIWSAIEQSELESIKHNTIPTVVFKRNRSKTYIVIEFEKFLDFIK